MAPRRRRLLRSGAGCPVSLEQRPTGRGPRTVARRRILRSCTAWPVALAPSRGAWPAGSPDHLIRGTGNALAGLAPSRGAAPRPVPCNAGTGNDVAGRALLHSRGCAQPPDTPQGHPRNDKQEWLVSAPGLHHPRAQAGGTAPVPRLADYACSRDHDAYGERGHAGKQQQFMKKPGHDSLPHQD